MQTDREFNQEKAKWCYAVKKMEDKLVKRRREIQYLAGGGSQGGGKPPERTAITSMTPASANRLKKYIDNYYEDFFNMITLTYGADWPTDGKEVKRNLNAFFERIRRTGWFKEYSLVWWLEFQQRGAPHIHMVTTGWMPMRFVATIWSEVSGAPAASSTRVESLYASDEVGRYAAKYAAKTDQKQVPEGYDHFGRFWGRRGRRPVVGPTQPKEVAAAIPGEARTLLRAWARAQEAAKTTGVAIGLPPLIAYLQPRTLRVYEHEGGWSIYGSAREIEIIWHYLLAL